MKLNWVDNLSALTRLLCSEPVVKTEENSKAIRVTVQKAQLLVAVITAPAVVALSLIASHMLKLPFIVPGLVGAASEIWVLRVLTGRDELRISDGMLSVRKTVLGLGFTRRFRLSTVCGFRYIDTSQFENGLKSLYFESQHCPYYFGGGASAESAAVILNAIARLAPTAVATS